MPQVIEDRSALAGPGRKIGLCYSRTPNNLEGPHREENMAADPEPKVLEGEWACTRNGIIEFPDMATVERWYSADEYKPLLNLRLGAASGAAIAVNGVPT